jgi:hypothetical protein
MRIKRIALIVVVVFSSLVVFGQDTLRHRGLRKENFFVGGNFGMTFGQYTLINVSPQLGYRFNKFVAAGLGLNLLYVSDKEKDLYGNDYRKVVQGVTGLNLFGRVYPLQYMMLQVQPEANYIFGKQIFYQPTRQSYSLDASIVPSLLVGGGFVMPSDRASLIISLMYDVLQDVNSPYGNKPVVNVGYNFNLR